MIVETKEPGSFLNNTILITGATGSIGIKLRRHFADRGIPVRLVCLNSSNDPQVITADLSVYDEAWARQFSAIDVVIHLAGNPYATASWDSVQRLNIDLSLNVFRAAQCYGTKRIVFASSNWVMAGYRFGSERLSPDLAPWPVNAYGCGKLLCERVGRELTLKSDLSFIALRIGCCQHVAGNIPGPQIEHGLWGQQMWLSDRDLCHGVERAALAEHVQFAVLNLMSNNPGMRWDLEPTRKVIGYAPCDGHLAISTPAIEAQEQLARLKWDVSTRFEQISAKW